MDRAVEAYMSSACVLVYDNLMLSFKVKHQRSDKLTATNNGSAITLLQLPSQATAVLNNGTFLLEHRRRIQELYMAKEMTFLSPEELFLPADDALINKQLQYNIVSALFHIPGLEHSKLLEDNRLKPPVPIDLLPSGEANCSKQIMLGTVDLDETTYAGSEAVMMEALSQLKQSSPEAHRAIAESRLQVWVGDQLTVDRGESLAAMKQVELNAFDRHDWTHWSPGWLHILMNLGRSVYFISYGNSTGLLFARDVANLHRSGLTAPTKQKGPEYHTLWDALLDILEARYWGLWMWYAGVSKLEELVDWANRATVDQVLEGTKQIWQQRASNRALTLLDQQRHVETATVGRKTVTKVSNQDPVLESVIRSTTHLMLFEEVHRSVRFGDVGMLDLLLPRLLTFFSGAGNPRYAKMMAHMLQWKLHEAPPGVNEIIRQYTWLVNFTGRPDGFYGIDHRQELNNLSIRMHGPPPQSATWEQYKMLSPAMPVLSAVIDQFDRQFSDFHHSRRHYIPDTTEDVKTLVQKQVTANIHGFDPSRTCGSGNNTSDPMAEGQQNLFNTDYLTTLWINWQKYYGLTNLEEVYPDQPVSMDILVHRIAGLNVDTEMREVDETGEAGEASEASEAEPLGGTSRHVTPSTSHQTLLLGYSPQSQHDPQPLSDVDDTQEDLQEPIISDEALELDEIANKFYSLSLDVS
ncbi:hypothetical protein FRC06_004077 [Ceratobasidium sp. 370]|nr:hypothetical protein FRC06_004077 [Ceratobasidium sp. 370]